MKIKKCFIFIIGVFLASCGNYVEKKAGGTDGDLNFSSSSLGFSTVQSAVFLPRCVSCHQQYNSYAGVKKEIDAISSAVSSNRMPKSGGPLSDKLSQFLQAWIAAGAPEFPGSGPGNPTPTLLEPNWKSISENIISPRCLVCHNPQGPAKFLDLTSRQVIFSARNRLFGVGVGKKFLDLDLPGNSYLLDVIQDPTEPMPTIWSHIRRLNVDEIKVLTDWIGLGLP